MFHRFFRISRVLLYVVMIVFPSCSKLYRSSDSRLLDFDVDPSQLVTGVDLLTFSISGKLSYQILYLVRWISLVRFAFRHASPLPLPVYSPEMINVTYLYKTIQN